MLDNADLKLLSGFKKVGVAVSGGMDSMALLHFLTESGIDTVAVHINHNLRGAESDRDENFVKEYCSENNIPCFVERGNVKELAKEKSESIELAARNFRLSVFYSLVSEGICDVIATAHHELDNAETLLMRIFRGTASSGLKGIELKRDIFVRPFLTVSKEEIEEYVKEKKVPYITDSSNFDNTFTRNFIRNELMPLIKSRFPDVESSLLRLSKSARYDEEFIDGFVTGGREKNGAVYISFDELTGPRAVCSRNILRAFEKLGIYKDIEQKHIESILNLKKDNANKLSMPFGITAVVENGYIVLYREIKTQPFSKPFKTGITEIENGERVLVRKYKEGDKIRFDIDKIPKDAVIRNRREGDIFRKFGGGSKKLNDYLTDIKFPVRQRDRLPLIASKNEILAICSVEISALIKDEKKGDPYTFVFGFDESEDE